MEKFIGLILLAFAVAAGIFIFSREGGLSKLAAPYTVKLEPYSYRQRYSDAGADQPSGSDYSSYGQSEIENRKLLTISSFRPANSYVSYSEIVLDSNLNSGETADITGWIIKGEHGSFTIPRAQEVFSSGGVEGNIVARSRDAIYLYSGFGPKGNFRLNKCLGYIEDVAPFTPPLPKDCPQISWSEMQRFGGYCRDYISSLDTCQTPNANPPVPLEDTACHAFLRDLNYVGCVANHRNDQDFRSNEWRVWMGDQMNIFDPIHDRIQLWDKSGKLVDEYIY